MDVSADFLEWLGPDTSTIVFMLLDDPIDIVRACAVSRSWRRFVILNGFCKKLCLRICADVSFFTRVIEASDSNDTTEEAGSSSAMEWGSLVREHKAYSYLCHRLVKPTGYGECINEAIRASSTDNYPDESIENTLIEADRVNMQPSYWSSRGECDPGTPETLLYRLCSRLCVVAEIKIQPFEAYFQYGSPIYSAKAVRFRMGHCVSNQNQNPSATDNRLSPQISKHTQDYSDEKFVWTYVSPEFPMAQQNELQTFTLPRPALCIGGMVQIELLGRVQVQDMDNQYYICVCHVQVIGRPLSPAFDMFIDEASGRPAIKYFPERQAEYSESLPGWRSFSFRERFNNLTTLGRWNHPILSTLLGVAEMDSDDEN